MRKRIVLPVIVLAVSMMTGCGNKDAVNTAMEIAGQILSDKDADEGEPVATNGAVSNGRSADQDASAEGISPEFKEAMDSYEAFFDEYIAFMEKYSSSNDSLSMMADYANYMTKFADAMDKMEKLDDGTLSDAESLYYLEVTLRIEQKLLAVSGVQ